MTKKRAQGGPVQANMQGEREGEELIVPASGGRVFARTQKGEDVTSAHVFVPSRDSHLVNLSLPRTAVEQILGTLMSAISKRAYGVRWITGTETTLPFVVAKTLDTHPKDGGAYTWGQTVVMPDEAQTLLSLAQALEYWVTWDETEKVYKPYKPDK